MDTTILDDSVVQTLGLNQKSFCTTLMTVRIIMEFAYLSAQPPQITQLFFVWTKLTFQIRLSVLRRWLSKVTVSTNLRVMQCSTGAFGRTRLRRRRRRTPMLPPGHCKRRWPTRGSLGKWCWALALGLALGLALLYLVVVHLPGFVLALVWASIFAVFFLLAVLGMAAFSHAYMWERDMRHEGSEMHSQDTIYGLKAFAIVCWILAFLFLCYTISQHSHISKAVVLVKESVRAFFALKFLLVFPFIKFARPWRSWSCGARTPCAWPAGGPSRAPRPPTAWRSGRSSMTAPPTWQR
ncbi:unnamed protein product [Heterosigma akashiwo]